MGFGWQGNLVRLAPLDVDKHLDHAVQWLNDPEVSRWLLIGHKPITRLAERDWFERQSKSADRDIVFAIETLDGKHVGFSGLHGISWRHGTATTGTVIGRREDQEKGYGRDAARTRARYAFEVLGLRMIYSGVYEGNERSLRMLKSAGYEECGRLPKKFWVRGAYVDEVLMVLMREKWLEGNTP